MCVAIYLSQHTKSAHIYPTKLDKIEIDDRALSFSFSLKILYEELV